MAVTALMRMIIVMTVIMIVAVVGRAGTAAGITHVVTSPLDMVWVISSSLDNVHVF
jgi:hypothetical protein